MSVVILTCSDYIVLVLGARAITLPTSSEIIRFGLSSRHAAAHCSSSLALLGFLGLLLDDRCYLASTNSSGKTATDPHKHQWAMDGPTTRAKREYISSFGRETV